MPGETVAIVGESGSGKSVTSLSIMRLLQPDMSKIEGKVMLGGRDLLALPEHEMRKVRGNDVAMIFQEPMTSLNPLLTIGDQISEALLSHLPISRLMRGLKPSAFWRRCAFLPPPLVSMSIRTDFPAACVNA